MSGTKYIHGTDPEEQRRLSRMNNLINEGSLREIQLRGDEKILDVGSGLGQFTRLMARVVHPVGKVIGIEKDQEQISAGMKIAAELHEESLAEIRNGDALNLPLSSEEWNSFDVIHCRFVLEHLQDPARAVKMMIEAARPGGRIVLADDDHDVLRLWPEVEGFTKLWNAYQESFVRNGNDPIIGRRLVQMLSEGGANPKRSTWMWFGACSGNPAFEILSENLVQVILGAKSPMIETGVVSSSFFDKTIGRLQHWSTLSDAALWYSISWAEGVKPGKPERKH